MSQEPNKELRKRGMFIAFALAYGGKSLSPKTFPWMEPKEAQRMINDYRRNNRVPA